MSLFQLPFDRLPKNTRKLYLAFSGGVDSTVLLHALLPYRQQYQIIVWHINHGLQKNAELMQQFAQDQAEQFALEFRVDSLNMNASENNLEAKARDHRYRLFEKTLSAGDVLLTAHHKNDQAETLLLNMMRGSGASGLRAIARQKPLGKGVLFRPLLNYSRDDIEQYAEDHQLQWIEDPSNKNVAFDRNYLRHEVLPVIIKRWPAAISQMQRVSELQNESEQLQTDLAQIDYAQAVVNSPFSVASCISVNFLNVLSLARKKNVLRYWIKANNFSVIGFHKIEELLKQLHSRADAMSVIEGNGFKIRLFKNMLFLVENSGSLKLDASYSMPDSGNFNIPGSGFYQSRADLYNYMKRQDEGEKLDLRFRQQLLPGEAMPHSHSLKRLFQKNLIPPWKRSSIPQIFLDDKLIGLWLL